MAQPVKAEEKSAKAEESGTIEVELPARYGSFYLKTGVGEKGDVEKEFRGGDVVRVSAAVAATLKTNYDIDPYKAPEKKKAKE